MLERRIWWGFSIVLLATVEVVEKNSATSESEGGEVSESDLVIEFLTSLAPDNPNVVVLGIALLLQMSTRMKAW